MSKLCVVCHHEVKESLVNTSNLASTSGIKLIHCFNKVFHENIFEGPLCTTCFNLVEQYDRFQQSVADIRLKLIDRRIRLNKVEEHTTLEFNNDGESYMNELSVDTKNENVSYVNEFDGGSADYSHCLKYPECYLKASSVVNGITEELADLFKLRLNYKIPSSVECAESSIKWDIYKTQLSGLLCYVKGEEICFRCQIKFQDHAKKIRHYLSDHHPGQNSYICTLIDCGESFADEILLADHQEACHQDVSHHVQPTKAEGISHDYVKVSNGGNVWFNCLRCAVKCIGELEFWIHWKYSHSIKLTKGNCPICRKHLVDVTKMRRHVFSDHLGLRFTCPACDWCCKDVNFFKHHIKRHLTSGPGQFVRKKSIEKISKHTCPECGRKFKELFNKALHLHKIHQIVIPVGCKKCGLQVSSCQELTKHRFSEHGRVFSCEMCGKMYSSAAILKSHIQSVHVANESGKTFACNLCDKKFYSRHNLKIHGAKHNNDQGGRHKCQQCQKSFRWYTSLSSHVYAAHTVERNFLNFKCDICDKRFKDGSNARAHRQCHLEEKRHKCRNISSAFPGQICGKSFVRKDQLRAHERICL